MRFKKTQKPKDNLLKYKNEIIQFSGINVKAKKFQKNNELNRKSLRKLERKLKHAKNLAFHAKKPVPKLENLIEKEIGGKRKDDKPKKGKNKNKKKKKVKKLDSEADENKVICRVNWNWKKSFRKKWLLFLELGQNRTIQIRRRTGRCRDQKTGKAVAYQKRPQNLQTIVLRRRHGRFT
jgi:hypothetical protein